jgi:hypothetical protein
VAAGLESVSGAAVYDALNPTSPSAEDAEGQDEGEEGDGVGQGVAYSQVRRDLRKKIVSLEDKLQVCFFIRTHTQWFVFLAMLDDKSLKVKSIFPT